MDYLFQLQVGYYDDDFNFTAHLYSVSEYYKDLYGVHTYEEGTILPPIKDWVPENFYTINPVIPSPPSVPEPSSSILCLLAASLLMLRRKKS